MRKPICKTGFTLWLTGLSGSGKSTIAQRLSEYLKSHGIPVEILDGDTIRSGIHKGLGFSKQDRDLNIRIIGYICGLLSRNGVVAISAAISPYRDIRNEIRADIRDFIEIYVDSPLDACISRDPKGLYRKALAGEISNFTGISDPYEPPEQPEIIVKTAEETLDESFRKIMRYLSENQWVVFQD